MLLRLVPSVGLPTGLQTVVLSLSHDNGNGHSLISTGFNNFLPLYEYHSCTRVINIMTEVQQSIISWNQLPAGFLASFLCSLSTFRKRVKKIVTSKVNSSRD
jgi:hypothetical protein